MAKSVYFLKWEDNESIYFVPYRSEIRDGSICEIHIYREFLETSIPNLHYPHFLQKWLIWITPQEYDDLRAGRNYAHFAELVNNTVLTAKPHFIYTY